MVAKKLATMPAPGVPIPWHLRLMRKTTQVICICIVVLVLLLWMGFFSGLQKVLPLQNIEIVGVETYYHEKRLQNIARPYLHKTHLFNVNIRHLAKDFESLSWVKTAIVQRQFPNRLQVTLLPQKAVALWGHIEDQQLLGDSGQLFTASWDVIKDTQIPHLQGPVGTQTEVLQMYQQIYARLITLDLYLVGLELDKYNGWVAKLQNDAQLQLGYGDKTTIDKRLEQFIQTVTELSHPYTQPLASYLQSADLRYPNGYAIAFKKITTGETP
jgi:cell division protein FtsQ